MDQQERHRIVAELVEDWLSALVLFARQWRHDSPEDIVHNAFLRLLEEHPFPRDPLAWLYVVIRNLSNNHLRSRKRRKNREEEASWLRPHFQDPLTPTDEHAELVRQLGLLEQEYREIITMKIWGGLSLEQIATVLDSSRSTVHRKYQQGLTLLHDKLEKPS